MRKYRGGFSNTWSSDTVARKTYKHPNPLVNMVEAMQATQVKNPDVELLEKLAQEHLETLKLLAKNGNRKTD